MYKQKLNQKLLQNFKSKEREDIGFLCILKLPSVQSISGHRCELQRYSRVEEASYRKTLNSAAVIIQKNYKSFMAKKLLKTLKEEKQKKFLDENAIFIQKNFRMFMAIKELKYLKLVKSIQNARENAAVCIQKNIRIFLLKKRLHSLYLITNLRKIRNLAAVFIQKRIRGYLTRKELYFVRHKKLCLLII